MAADDLEDLLPGGESTPEAPEQPSADGDGAASADTPEEPTPKRPGKFRWWTVIAVPVIALGSGLVLWIGGDHMLTSAIRDSIRDRGLELGEQTRLEAQFLGGKVALTDAELIAHSDEETRVMLRSPRAAVDLAIWDTITSGDVIVEELSMRDAVIDLRRFPDGSIPGPEATPEEVPPDAEEQDEAPPRDWVESYERVRKWYDRAQDWTTDDEAEDAEPEQPVQPAEGWDQAKRFYPTPEPGDPLPLPRVLIRSLDLGGKQLRLPDATGEDAEAPLDLAEFALRGSDVSLRPVAGESMNLAFDFTTRGAGDGSIALVRALEAGSLQGGWDAIPLPVVAAEEVAGARIAKWRPRGTAVLAIDAEWQGEVLDGTIVVDLEDLELHPRDDAGEEAHELAKTLAELSSLHQEVAGEEPFVLRWQLELGGSPQKPEIENLGPESMLLAIQQQARELVERKARAAIDEGKEAVREAGEQAFEDLKEGDVEGATEDLEGLEDKKDELKNLFNR